jgi:hypothetical protein
MTVFFCVSLFICVNLRASAVGFSDGDNMTRDRAQVSTGTHPTIFLCLPRPRKRGALHDVPAGLLISSTAPLGLLELLSCPFDFVRFEGYRWRFSR